MSEKNQKTILYEENQNHQLTSLILVNDPYQMNWVEGKGTWGTVKIPDGIEVNLHREMLKNGNLKERYCFTNISKFPVFFQDTDTGIYTTFNDNYEDADTCMTNKCHTHIFCGGEITYVKTLRMGGKPPHLGLVLTKGSIRCYSVERPETIDPDHPGDVVSNDRGDFILHPGIELLEPGETYEVSWELFAFEDDDSFEWKLLEQEDFAIVKTEQFTYFVDEKIKFDVITHADSAKLCQTIEKRLDIDGSRKDIDNTIRGTKAKVNNVDGKCVFSFECDVKRAGEIPITIQVGKKTMKLLFWGSEKLETLASKRCHFIAENQQYHNQMSHLDGAYLIYDNEEKKMYYRHDVDDHNGGRERIVMGALMALWLQNHEDHVLCDSLDAYESYVYRELYHRETGETANDIMHDITWHRLYNYPWMAVFQIELYHLKKDKQYVLDAYHTMVHYYELGGSIFYAIGIPMTELIKALEQEKLIDEKRQLLELFYAHIEHIYQTGSSFPKSEVAYEQSIVAPAVSYLLQGFLLFREEKYLEKGEELMKILRLFNGQQPNCYQYENAIRHWDGYWFGKNQMLGDTYPHYWSTLTGNDEILYGQIMDKPQYTTWGEASLRGCLCLFNSDGSASCARVFPQTVNGRRADRFDPWANDQDWALYYFLKWSEQITFNHKALEERTADFNGKVGPYDEFAWGDVEGREL